MSEVFRDNLYWTALGAGSVEKISVGFVILVIKTILMVLCSQHSSSLVAHFVVFFVSWFFPKASMVFFMVCWFSLPLLLRKRLIKNDAVCCNFPGLSVSNPTSSPSSYSFSTTFFVNACSWAVGAMSPLLLRVFK